MGLIVFGTYKYELIVLLAELLAKIACVLWACPGTEGGLESVWLILLANFSCTVHSSHVKLWFIFSVLNKNLGAIIRRINFAETYAIT